MQCEEVQEYLAERLAGSLSDRLSGTVHTYVRTHMLSCSECCEELEDFEEMQGVLRIIPVEPCDSTAMRARFELLMDAEEGKVPAAPSVRLWPSLRSVKILFASVASLAVLTAAVFVVRQVWHRIPVAGVETPVPAQPSKPVAVPVRTGAMSGQVRATTGEQPRSIRVAVIAVPPAGTPASSNPARSVEIAVEANAEGHYKLDNIPAGRYYVLASSIDPPTYYPGSPDVAGATIVSIQPGAVLEGIDFSRFVAAVKPEPPLASEVKANVSGRVTLEDGSEVVDTPSLGEGNDQCCGERKQQLHHDRENGCQRQVQSIRFSRGVSLPGCHPFAGLCDSFDQDRHHGSVEGQSRCQCRFSLTCGDSCGATR